MARHIEEIKEDFIEAMGKLGEVAVAASSPSPEKVREIYGPALERCRRLVEEANMVDPEQGFKLRFQYGEFAMAVMPLNSEAARVYLDLMSEISSRVSKEFEEPAMEEKLGRYYDHPGRPGQVGGSLPRASGAGVRGKVKSTGRSHGKGGYAKGVPTGQYHAGMPLYRYDGNPDGLEKSQRGKELVDAIHRAFVEGGIPQNQVKTHSDNRPLDVSANFSDGGGVFVEAKRALFWNGKSAYQIDARDPKGQKTRWAKKHGATPYIIVSDIERPNATGKFYVSRHNGSFRITSKKFKAFDTLRDAVNYIITDAKLRQARRKK